MARYLIARGEAGAARTWIARKPSRAPGSSWLAASPLAMISLALSCSSSDPATSGSGGATSGGSSNGGASGSSGNGAQSGGSTGSGGTGSGGRPNSGSGGASAAGSGGTAGSGGQGASSGGSAAASSGGTAGSAGTAGSGGAPGNAGTAGGGSNAGGSSAGGSAGAAGAGGAPVACEAPSTATGTAATVTVDVSATPLATVGAEFMGIHTSVYDGTMQNPTTPDLLKAAGVKSLRYPGGSYGDIYHWSTHGGTVIRSDNGNSELYLAKGTDFGNFAKLLQKIGAKAFITVNYGTNLAGTGPGSPQEAAAWVAYANGLSTNTTAIGADASGQDWKTVGYWAGLRAAAPLEVDDGQNFLRIAQAAPVGINHWEIGNELYGNGYYYGGCGWEPDLHVPYAAVPAACTGRQNNAALSPAAYGAGVKAFATAMKAVDPTVKVGAIVHWPYTEYADWNDKVLPEACASVDFVVNHWYAGTTLKSLLTIAHTDIPAMYKDLRAALTKTANACGAKGATMPIALSEWGVNTYRPSAPELADAFAPEAPAVPTHTQLAGIFATETYANLMEQSALSSHWLELHSGTYLTATDAQAWGYHAALQATRLGGAGDTLLPATLSNAGTLATALLPHAAKRADGGVNVLLTNTSATETAAVTVNVTGGTTFACVGTRHAYVPVNTDNDGTLTSAPIFSSTTGASVAVTVPPYSVVVVSFPKR